MRFRFYKEIGSGGFGVVRRAGEVGPNKVVVRKDLAAKFLSEELDADEEARSRFVREVRLLQEELDHENVIEVVGRNLSASPPWFVMPLADGNLEEEIESGRFEDIDEAIGVFGEILAGVAHAHDREIPILHRDLKPKNVLICDGAPRIADFGLGKRMDPDATGLTKTAMWMGSEPYMAPEQFQDAKRVGPEADVYALGKILSQMLTGREPEILYVGLDEVPKEFRFFIEKCCRRDPSNRYRNAAEAAAAFAVFSAGSERVNPPLEGAEQIVAEWAEAEDDDEREEIVRRFDEHLIRNGKEEELYFKIVPRLPEGLIDLYMEVLPDAFKTMIATYDEHIVGGLPFAYCDVVADFYARLFRRSDDLEVKRMLISRLIEMGASHNRWYVGGVVATLLSEVEDVSTAMIVAEEIAANPEHAAWFWDPWMRATALQQQIRGAFDETSTGPT